jgi:hypothetical protein
LILLQGGLPKASKTWLSNLTIQPALNMDYKRFSKSPISKEVLSTQLEAVKERTKSILMMSSSNPRLRSLEVLTGPKI